MPRLFCLCLHIPACMPLPSPSLRISATYVYIIPHIYCYFNQQSTSLLPFLSAFLIIVCLRLFHIRHLVFLLLLFSHFYDDNVFITSHLYHFIPCCTTYLTTLSLYHTYFTTIIICSHQCAPLMPTSFSHIPSINIIIISHLTTSTPPNHSS